MAEKIGVDHFLRYQHIFGFGEYTGIDLPGEADNAALIFTEDTMGPTDLACNAFGQSFNCTMIQMAAAFASVINGGSYYEPHVVKQILNDQGSIVKEVEPKLVRETISEATSDFVRGALFDTIRSAVRREQLRNCRVPTTIMYFLLLVLHRRTIHRYWFMWLWIRPICRERSRRTVRLPPIFSRRLWQISCRT